MNAIMVAVDYTDLLKVTLPYNRHHFDKVVVVTDPRCAYDMWDVCEANDALCFSTNAFYRDGAHFNKWLALEEGLDFLGRKGWLCLMDADVLWPKVTDLTRYLHAGYLYSPLRRMYEDLKGTWNHGSEANRDDRSYPPEVLWKAFHLHRNVAEWAGYSQIFHADDPVLGPPPWHEVDWKHAGGADSFFQAKWPNRLKVRPHFEVLHLGPAGMNWFGRATPFLDGSMPQGVVSKEEMTRKVWTGRRERRAEGKDPFAPEKIH